tara:strand:- start:4848 stop:7952 length:3105 start_codon:yes stop_codon:yes gene_type:complete
MAVNKLMKEVEAKRAESLSALMAISRDLEAYLAGPKELSVRIGPKYERIDGRKGSTSALDKEYRDALKSFTPASLGRVFGPNKDLVAVARDVRDELKSVYGASSGLATYVDTATQAIMQVLISGAYSVPDADGFTYLKSAKDFLVEESKKTGGVTAALEALNKLGSPQFVTDVATTATLVSLFKGNVFRFLTPLSYEHLKQLEAKYLPKLQSRSVMETYIANAQAQLAASRYVNTRVPADNVLLPQAIGGNTQDDVQSAMLQYGKDVVATFNYYKAAVEAEFDMSSGVQTGQVEAALKGASRALKSAGDAVRLTGALPAVIKDIKSEFNSIAREISSIKLKEAAQAQYDISMAYAKIVDALGADKSSALVVGSLKTTVEGILDTLDVASDFGFQDEAYEDSLEDIRPTSLSLRAFDSIPAIADFQEAVSSALGLLNVAHGGLVSVGLRGITGTAPTAPAIKRPAITDAFKSLARAQMNDVFAALKTVASGGQVNESGYKAGIMAAFADIFGIRGAFDSLTFAPPGGTANPLTDMKITQIADGRLPTLSTRTVGGQTIKERMLSVARTAAGSSAQRRETAGALTQSIDLVLESLNGLRVQAESIGMRIRQNPAFSRGERVKNALMYGGGSLVGNHAISAGINKFVAPESGSALAYLTTYGSSVATIGAAVKMAEDEETRNDIIVGAGLHMAARAALTFFPAARFSNNIFAKILQAPTSGVANIIGDQSLAASALTPVNLEAHKDELAEYVLTLVKTNNVKTLPYIAVQLANAGLVVKAGQLSDAMTYPATFSIRDTRGDVENLFLLFIKSFLMDAEVAKVVKADKNVLTLPDDAGVNGTAFIEAHEKAFNKTVTEYAEATKDLKSTKKAVAAEDTARTNGLGQFILEPGYNMDVYSGADHASYLQPAPIQTSQSGFAQLENAINRARRLSNREKAQEGISDMSHVDIIRATPKTVRMAEKAGMGTSLGQSRSNPNHELLALEVQGANGLWPVSPARQRSVPQGALNYTKIGHAPDIAVSPHGLFNKGAFTPNFGG